MFLGSISPPRRPISKAEDELQPLSCLWNCFILKILTSTLYDITLCGSTLYSLRWLRCSTGFSLVLQATVRAICCYPYSFCLLLWRTSAHCAVFTQGCFAKKSGDALSGLTSLMVVSFHHRPYLWSLELVPYVKMVRWNTVPNHGVFFGDEVEAVFKKMKIWSTEHVFRSVTRVNSWSRMSCSVRVRLMGPSASLSLNASEFSHKLMTLVFCSVNSTCSDVSHFEYLRPVPLNSFLSQRSTREVFLVN